MNVHYQDYLGQRRLWLYFLIFTGHCNFDKLLRQNTDKLFNCQHVLAVLVLLTRNEFMILGESPNISYCHSSQGRMETKEWITREPTLLQSKLKLTDMIMTVNAV
jgi:hypothetical protein